MNRREANVLDRYLTEPTEKLYKETYEDDPVDTTDCFGNVFIQDNQYSPVKKLLHKIQSLI